jgi:predicted ATPase
MRDEHQFVSVFDASEGSLYVLFVLALVGHRNSPPFLAIDNFDQALHPRLASALMRLISEQLIKSGERQIMVTTHNPLVLDGLDLLDDRIRLFAIDRDPRGATQVKKVEVTDELMAHADAGLSLSRLWVMGLLGGVPRSL